MVQRPVAGRGISFAYSHTVCPSVPHSLVCVGGSAVYRLISSRQIDLLDWLWMQLERCCLASQGWWTKRVWLCLEERRWCRDTREREEGHALERNSTWMKLLSNHCTILASCICRKKKTSSVLMAVCGRDESNRIETRVRLLVLPFAHRQVVELTSYICLMVHCIGGVLGTPLPSLRAVRHIVRQTINQRGWHDARGGKWGWGVKTFGSANSWRNTDERASTKGSRNQLFQPQKFLLKSWKISS